MDVSCNAAAGRGSRGRQDVAHRFHLDTSSMQLRCSSYSSRRRLAAKIRHFSHDDAVRKTGSLWLLPFWPPSMPITIISR